MGKYIDVKKLIAEIERRKVMLDTESPFGVGGRVELELVLNTITSLQQEQPEVDLEKEIKSYFKGFGMFPSVGIDDCIDIAKYFFELGLNARKEE